MRITKLIGVVLVSVLAVGVSMATNAGAETFEVSAAAAEGTFSAATGTTSFIDNGAVLSCEESSIAGQLKEGTEVLGEELGEITEAKWNKGEETCKGPLGITFGETASTPWSFSAKRALNGGTEIGTEIEQIAIQLHGTICSFLVKGAAPAIWDNKTQTLIMNQRVDEEAEAEGWGVNALATENVEGCLGIVNNGDKPVFEAESGYIAEEGSDILIK